MTSRTVALSFTPAYARAIRAGQRRANDLPRGTGGSSSGTAATYLAAMPAGPFDARTTIEGSSTMQDDRRTRL